VAFLSDTALVGEAVAAACSASDPGLARVNYEILGNAFAHLHAHVRARYSWQEPAVRTRPVWCYPDLLDPGYALSGAHDELRAELTRRLVDLGGRTPDRRRCDLRPSGFRRGGVARHACRPRLGGSRRYLWRCGHGRGGVARW